MVLGALLLLTAHFSAPKIVLNIGESGSTMYQTDVVTVIPDKQTTPDVTDDVTDTSLVNTDHCFPVSDDSGSPYDEQSAIGLSNQWQRLQALAYEDLVSRAEHGDEFAMLRLSQLTFHQALPNHGFLQDRFYTNTETQGGKLGQQEWLNSEATFEQGIYWAKQAALHGNTYALNLLGRAYLAQLMQSLNPKAQWLVGYFTYRQLWQQQSGAPTEPHSMLIVLDDVEASMQQQITAAKDDFNQQRIQLGLLATAPCA